MFFVIKKNSTICKKNEHSMAKNLDHEKHLLMLFVIEQNSKKYTKNSNQK